MNILMLKLILAPVIIGSASMAGRRWGAAVSGWLVGLPLTSGPVAFFLALSHDRAFVFDSVRGTLSGGFSLVAFSLTYAWVSRKFNWVVSILSGVVVFASMTTLLQNITIPFLPLSAFWCGDRRYFYRLAADAKGTSRAARFQPRWMGYPREDFDRHEFYFAHHRHCPLHRLTPDGTADHDPIVRQHFDDLFTSASRQCRRGKCAARIDPWLVFVCRVLSCAWLVDRAVEPCSFIWICDSRHPGRAGIIPADLAATAYSQRGIDLSVFLIVQALTDTKNADLRSVRIFCIL